tara:strand:- start:2220 stop:3368 length:1149 start_codon:yes stop_codon:yes gene_type:complete
MDGPVRALNQLVAFLEKQGVEVLVFAPTVAKPAFKHAGTLISVPSLPMLGRSEYRVGLGLPRSVRKVLDDFNPNLIHLAAPELIGFAAQRYARKNNIPAVASFHTRFDTYFRYYKLGWLEKYLTAGMRRFYNRCEHVYVPSDSMRKVLRDEGVGRELRIWARGVDTTLFCPQKRDMNWRRGLGIEDHEKIILFVGRLVLEKGLDAFADVIDGLKTQNIPHRAVFVGEGPARDFITERLPDAILTGFLEGEDLARAYASADIFLNPSITETFGNVTLEAMASGIPALCANATGSQSLVQDGITGFLAKPDNTEDYLHKIKQMISDPALYSRMATASLQRGQQYSWDNVLHGLLQQYYEVIEQPSHKKEAAQGHSNTVKPSPSL